MIFYKNQVPYRIVEGCKFEDNKFNLIDIIWMILQ